MTLENIYMGLYNLLYLYTTGSFTPKIYPRVSINV